jgi:hypothetical protein
LRTVTDWNKEAAIYDTIAGDGGNGGERLLATDTNARDAETGVSNGFIGSHEHDIGFDCGETGRGGKNRDGGVRGVTGAFEGGPGAHRTGSAALSAGTFAGGTGTSAFHRTGKTDRLRGLRSFATALSFEVHGIDSVEHTGEQGEYIGYSF